MRMTEQAAAAADDRHSRRGAETAPTHAVGAINQLQVRMLELGRFSAAGNRVGLGKIGGPIG